MRYDFFADKDDQVALLDYIFTETELQVFDLSSAYGEEVRQYRNSGEIRTALEGSGSNLTMFQLWAPQHLGKAAIRKIELDPRRCKGHTFRYETNGFGLIQLYLGGLSLAGLHRSYLGHFTEVGAAKSEGVGPHPGRVMDWDWKAIRSTSGKLKRHLQSHLAVKTKNGFGILEGASRLEAAGIQLL